MKQGVERQQKRWRFDLSKRLDEDRASDAEKPLRDRYVSWYSLHRDEMFSVSHLSQKGSKVRKRKGREQTDLSVKLVSTRLSVAVGPCGSKIVQRDSLARPKLLYNLNRLHRRTAKTS